MNLPSCGRTAPLSPLPSSLAGGHRGVICLFLSDSGNIGFSAAKNMQLEIQGEPNAMIFNLDKAEKENSVQTLLLGVERVGRLKVSFKIIKTCY